MSDWTPVAAVGAVAVVAMTAVWYVKRRTGVAGWVDVAWSYLIAAAAVYYALLGTAPWWQRIAVALMGLFWGVRLGTHLVMRLRQHKEDSRYAFMGQAIGESAFKWYLFFLFQAGLTLLFSLPFFVAANNQSASLPWLSVGIVIFVVALSGEAIADRQLARFAADPANRGKVCEVGLWGWSRHPNYFFEWVHWFAYVALAVGAANAWLAWLGNALMLATLLFVTGIPFNEQQSLRSRGDAYRDYQRRVSMFIPWWPKANR